MDPFKSVTVIFGLIIGLGVARILSGGVNVFRSRSRAKIDWIPLLWAGCIFLWQLQFWWAIIELPHYVSTWSIQEFVAMVLLTLLLFVAAALILPASDIVPGDTLAEEFRRDGRWSLILLSLYFVMASGINWWLFDTPLYSYPALLNIGLILLPLLYLRVTARWHQATVSVLYAILALWSAWEASPHAYLAD